MKLYQAIADGLLAEGCDRAFGLMGDGNMPLWAAMVDRGVQMVSTRHEATAVGMADGYHRATGKVGVATVTWGPGLTQAMTQMLTAARHGSAVVVLTGLMPKGSRDVHQFVDHDRIAALAEMEHHVISSADDAAAQMAEAFHAARNRKQAVLLSVPLDLQYADLEWGFDYRPSTDFGFPVPPQAAPDAALEPIRQALVEAERPVIIAGRGARQSEARDAIIALAEASGALLATSLLGKGLFSDQPWDIGIAGSFASAPGEHLFAEADFVLGIGAQLGHYTSEGGFLFPSATVARIDLAPLPSALGPLPGLYASGDARLSVERLNALFAASPRQTPGYRTDAARAIIDTPVAAPEPAGDGLDPRQLFTALSEALPRNARVICGVGHFWGFVNMYLALPPTIPFHSGYDAGAIAQGLIQALGVAADGSGAPTLVIEGDGSLLCHIQEIETAVRHGLSLVVLVANDNGFGAEVHKLRAKGMNPALGSWTGPDLVAIARSLGAEATALESEDQIGAAIERAVTAGGVHLIDMRVSPTTMTDTYTKLHFGGENRAPILRVQPAVSA
ncbi:MAG: thiamine pyrophosphate-binding protein [Rhodobacter sp.]|nr:thiamine pyrophosphate-binding protein [Paracoccaceae bacterium]MCC0077252.1 thiamine pyrophosphate-binding protein [Rhodobacter sp.]